MDGENIVGMIKYRPEQRTDSAEVEILLAWILVDHRQRRSKIGSRLMEEYEAELRNISGAIDRRIASVADVAIRNGPSQALFIRWGYTATPGSTHDSQFFRKSIV